MRTKKSAKPTAKAKPAGNTKATEPPPYVFGARNPKRPTVAEMWTALREERHRAQRLQEKYDATLEARLDKALDSIDDKLTDIEIEVGRGR